MTGLSGSGKTTLAEALAVRLRQVGRWCCILDGDALRAGLSCDLGFSPADRSEHLRRVAETARLVAASGAIAVVATISPAAADRAKARQVASLSGLRFIEVHLDAPLAVCEARDAKGLYRRARAGHLSGFTGLDAPYEPPTAPDVRVGPERSPDDAAEIIVAGWLAGDLMPQT